MHTAKAVTEKIKINRKAGYPHESTLSSTTIHPGGQ